MSATYQKPKGVRYVDMAIYIDEHLKDIKEPNKYPQIEAKIFEYIYHLVYMLALKSSFFKNFDDYDDFSIFAATDLFLAMRKKLLNEGKEIRGKVVVPIKSSLNFIKATLFPLKINYQRDSFAMVFDSAIQQGSEQLEEIMKDEVRQQYRAPLESSYADAAALIPNFINDIVSKTPFRSDPLMVRKLYISIALSLLNDLTLPNAIKNRLYKKHIEENETKELQKMYNAYTLNSADPILWHLNADFENYIKLLTIRVKKKFSLELSSYIHSDELSDEMLDDIINSAYDNYFDDLGN